MMDNNNSNNEIKVEFKKEFGDKEREQFDRDGFIFFDNIISCDETMDKLKERSVGCFFGKQDKGTWADEYTWRSLISRDDVARELCNAWKTDTFIAKYVLNEQVAKMACQILQCDSVRVVQDDIFWKPVSGDRGKTGAIGMHQDIPYFAGILPKQVITAWIALTDVSPENGTLEFATGSHKWKDLDPSSNTSNEGHEFHSPVNYVKGVTAAAEANGIKPEDIKYYSVTGKRGCATFHHGKLWHGSASNPSKTTDRMSIAIHFMPGNVSYDPNEKPGYNFGRYKMYGTYEMNESFYPITYSKNGYRSPIIDDAIKL